MRYTCENVCMEEMVRDGHRERGCGWVRVISSMMFSLHLCHLKTSLMQLGKRYTSGGTAGTRACARTHKFCRYYAVSLKTLLTELVIYISDEA